MKKRVYLTQDEAKAIGVPPRESQKGRKSPRGFQLSGKTSNVPKSQKKIKWQIVFSVVFTKKFGRSGKRKLLEL